jgi:hypothetical protein
VIYCASIYPAVLLRPGHRKNRALGPASLEGGQGLVGGRRRWGGRRRAGRALAIQPGTPAPADQREETTSVSQCSATQRRKSFGSMWIQSTYGLDIAGSS